MDCQFFYFRSVGFDFVDLLLCIMNKDYLISLFVGLIFHG